MNKFSTFNNRKHADAKRDSKENEQRSIKSNKSIDKISNKRSSTGNTDKLSSKEDKEDFQKKFMELQHKYNKIQVDMNEMKDQINFLADNIVEQEEKRILLSQQIQKRIDNVASEKISNMEVNENNRALANQVMENNSNNMRREVRDNTELLNLTQNRMSKLENLVYQRIDTNFDIDLPENNVNMFLSTFVNMAMSVVTLFLTISNNLFVSIMPFISTPKRCVITFAMFIILYVTLTYKVNKEPIYSIIYNNMLDVFYNKSGKKI